MANPAEYLHIKQGDSLYAIGCTRQAPLFKFVSMSVNAIAPRLFIHVASGIGIRRQHTDTLYRTNTTYAANIW